MRAFIVASIIISLFILVFFLLADRRVLIADENLMIVENLENETQLPLIMANSRLGVRRCDDQKSIIYPIVVTENGKERYVISGKFHFEKLSVFAFGSIAPINFSCP